jgi:hypothetical protein
VIGRGFGSWLVVSAVAGCGLDLVGTRPSSTDDAGVDASIALDASSSSDGSSPSDAGADAAVLDAGGPFVEVLALESLSTANVTSEGTLDWAVWGPGGLTSPVRKNGVTPMIDGFTATGPDLGTAALSFPLTVSWSDGAPPVVSGSTIVHAYAGNGVGAKLGLDAAATTSVRTLALYLGAYEGTCQLTATLSDGSANPGSLAFAGPNGGFKVGRVRVRYAAASASAKLGVSWTTVTSTATYCDVIAATLQ